METFFTIIIVAVPLIMAIVLHELGHGLVAYWCGDPTASQAGRLTLNPLKHMDPVGSFILPGLLILTTAPFLFGYAKPVPVNQNKLHHPRLQMIFVALAGPLVNFFLAFVSASLLIMNDPWFEGDPFLQELLVYSLRINVVLALFNLLPLFPLDGSHVIRNLIPVSILPERLFRAFGIIGIAIILLSPTWLSYIGINPSFLSHAIEVTTQTIFNLLNSLINH